MHANAAKIVCTLGPASQSVETLTEMVDAGMSVARLNLSHGHHEEHAARERAVREASDVTGRAVGVMADLQGPKIRLGRFREGRVQLLDGAEFSITVLPVEGTDRLASCTYDQLAHDVRPGDSLLIDDGLVRLEALASDGETVRCRVVEGGWVSDAKGINLPGVAVSSPALTPKDADDLRFALELGVDLVALSFVRAPRDIDVVLAIMDRVGRRVPVIAKLEKPEAVERLVDVIDAFDAVMVARGDLGVELPLERVPGVQKSAVRVARRQAKPVIVATQMLESMIQNPRPTRAETSDVANAVLDGADAVMLSAETSVGRHPVEAVRTMTRIIGAAEQEHMDEIPDLRSLPGVADAITSSAVDIADGIGAVAIVAFTETGNSARRLARHRPHLPLMAFTPHPSTRSQLAVVWGIETFVVPPVDTTDDMVAMVETNLLALGRARVGDRVVVVAGTPPRQAGTTNTIRVRRLGT
jgi:pyruvate kinase